RRAAVVVLDVTPRVRVLPQPVEAHGELGRERLIVIDGEAEAFPRADGGGHLRRAAAGVGPLEQPVGGAAHRSAAKEDRVRAAGEVEALQVVAVVIVVGGKELDLLLVAADPPEGAASTLPVTK